MASFDNFPLGPNPYQPLPEFLAIQQVTHPFLRMIPGKMLRALHSCLIEELKNRNAVPMSLPEGWAEKHGYCFPVIVKCANGHMNVSIAYCEDSGQFEAWEFDEDWRTDPKPVNDEMRGNTPAKLFDALKQHEATFPVARPTV